MIFSSSLAYIPLASLIVGILALVGVYYTKKQVDLLRADSKEKTRWALRHAHAVDLVLKTHRFSGGTTDGGVLTNVYSLVFPELQFCLLVETYIVGYDWKNNLVSPRVLDADHFTLPVVQQVIERTIETVERFTREQLSGAARWDWWSLHIAVDSATFSKPFLPAGSGRFLQDSVTADKRSRPHCEVA